MSVSAASARRFSMRNSDTSDRGYRSGAPVSIYIQVLESVMGFTPTETIWFNGKLVPWGDAKVHVLAHGLQYGTGVFEGMKSYPTADGPAIFRLDAHLERFYKSAELYDLVIPYPQEHDRRGEPRGRAGQQARGVVPASRRLLRRRHAERLDRGMPGHRRDRRRADRQVPRERRRRRPGHGLADPQVRQQRHSRRGRRPAASTSTRRAR